MTSRDNDRVFDYVIVGAGTAGCVLANRLSEDQANRVCLIEAGPKDSNPFIHVPALVAAAMVRPSIVWGYWSAPQPNLNGRKVPIPRVASSVVRARSTAWCISAAIRETTTIGLRRGTEAGAIKKCSPISSVPRTTMPSMALLITEKAGR